MAAVRRCNERFSSNGPMAIDGSQFMNGQFDAANLAFLRKFLRFMHLLAGVDPAQCVFINDTPPHAHEHQIDWLLRLGYRVPERFRTTFAGTTSENARAAQLPVSAVDRVDCLDWLTRRGLLGRPLVLLQPANKRTMRWNGVRPAHDDDKAWPVDRWAALAHAVASRQPEARLLLCGASDERRYLQRIRGAANLNVLTSACGELPLPRLKALLEIAHSMVSVDTGPAHLAAAMGCPLVVLFGARSPDNWAPRSNGATPVAILGGLPATRRVDALTVEQVVQAWIALGHSAAARPATPVGTPA